MKIQLINGASSSGKTQLAKQLGNKDYIYKDMCEPIAIYSIEELGSIDTVLNTKNKFNNLIFSKLRYVDPRVIKIVKTDDDELEAILDTNESVSISNISKKYIKILFLILAIRNNKNLIIDNIDALYSGPKFNYVIEILISEILHSKSNVIITTTNMNLMQLLCVSIPKNISKKMILTMFNFKDKTYEILELDYPSLAYFINATLNKKLRKELKEQDYEDISAYELEVTI